MVKLEVLKKNCFLDYKSVDKYLNQAEMRLRGENHIGSPIKTVSLTRTSNKPDDIFSPLSSNSIVDKQPVIEFPLCISPTG